MSNDTLLLNANGAPLSVTPLSTLTWQESIKLIWLDKINVLEWHDWTVRSVNHSMHVPSVICVRPNTCHTLAQLISVEQMSLYVTDILVNIVIIHSIKKI